MQTRSSTTRALLTLLLCLWLCAGRAAAIDNELLARLSPSAQEVAKDLGILPSVEKLLQSEAQSGKETLETLRLRQQLTEDIVEASFEIRSALSRIDSEVATANEERDLLEDKRQKRVEKSNVINFMNSGATDILATSMTNFPHSNGFGVPAGIIGVVGGSLQIGISTYTLRLNQGDHLSRPAHANSLAPVFGYTGSECQFPTGVWNYLNDPEPGIVNAGETRRTHLVKQWRKLHKFDDPSSKQGVLQIGLITGTIPEHKTLTIDVLDDRALMFADLRAAISQMDTDMLEIMRWVKSL
jgi:hypothetical protein